MGIDLDRDIDAEVERARSDAREAVDRARLLVERSRSLLLGRQDGPLAEGPPSDEPLAEGPLAEGPPADRPLPDGRPAEGPPADAPLIVAAPASSPGAG